MKVMKPVKAKKAKKAKKVMKKRKPRMAQNGQIPMCIQSLEDKWYMQGGRRHVEMMWWNANWGVFRDMSKKEVSRVKRFMKT